ncbi:hypothetical protein V1281_000392 [Nitrobacteraceae bacterium AZCC 2161]
MRSSDDGTVLLDNDRILTGAAADSAEAREEWQRLPRLLRYTLLGTQHSPLQLESLEPPKAAVQLAQHIADKLPDLPQRMVRRYSCLRRDVREQPALIQKSASHVRPIDSR